MTTAPLFRYAWAILLSLAVACKTTGPKITRTDDGQLEAIFVQINDVYEISPLAGGREGGMARVATLKNKYQQTNPNTFMVMAGDFLSPSVYNSLPFEGKPIRGRQMVDALNVAGLDLAVFGNHEFDIKETELQDRLNESTFRWISSNTFHQTPGQVQPFAKTNGPKPEPFPKTYILSLADADGTRAKIGFIGLTLPFNKAGYVSYTDPFTTARELYNQLKDSVDAVVAITHQSMEDDKKLAAQLPELALILGGHEHDGRFDRVGNVVITKALANAKSAYVVKLILNKRAKTVQAVPTLETINENIPPDSATNAVVQKWTDIAAQNYQKLGFDAQKVILAAGEPLDGRESEIRSHPTNLTRLVTAAVADAAPLADVVLLNAGSIRVDDVLPLPVTQYDIIRSLPFGGGIREVTMTGSLLQQILNQGQQNKGIGGYLLTNEAVSYQDQTNIWHIKNIPLAANKIYRVALGDFLLTGQEANLGFLTLQNPGIKSVFDLPKPGSPLADVRLAIVKYLENKK